MNAHGNNGISIFLQQLFDDSRAFRTVDTTLTGEVLQQHTTADIGRFYVDESFALVDMATSRKQHQSEE